MKVILEHIKLIITVVAMFIGMGWAAYAFLDTTYVETAEYRNQCTAWKAELDILRVADAELEEAIAGLSKAQMIQNLQQQVWWYQRKIDEFHQTYGMNCAQCDQFNRDTYWHYRREYDRLQKELNRLQGYGK
jgi:hypothetical protein